MSETIAGSFESSLLCSDVFAMTATSSPGNMLMPDAPPMRLPFMHFLYRLECEMSPDEQFVGQSSTSQSSRLILPFAGGTVEGPEISAVILSVSGADWATSSPGTNVRCSILDVCTCSLLTS